jgi:hypothetical protein
MNKKSILIIILYIQINMCLSLIYFRPPFLNKEEKFSISKAVVGKLDLIERRDIERIMLQDDKIGIYICVCVYVVKTFI